MISPALMLSWIWGRKRKPMPEYQSPNTWSDYLSKNNEVLALQEELVDTFNGKQMKLYRKLREKTQMASMAKPWQGEYAKLFNIQDYLMGKQKGRLKMTNKAKLDDKLLNEVIGKLDVLIASIVNVPSRSYSKWLDRSEEVDEIIEKALKDQEKELVRNFKKWLKGRNINAREKDLIRGYFNSLKKGK